MPQVADDYLTMTQAAVYIHSLTGSKVFKRDAITRWVTRGKLRWDGKRVKLTAVKVGKLTVTRKAWVRKFLKDISNTEDME